MDKCDKEFIRMTAKGYEMDFDEVKEIYLRDKVKLYENLEIFIKERRHE